MVNVGFNSEFYTNGSPLVASQLKLTPKGFNATPQVIVISADGNKALGYITGTAATEKKHFHALAKIVDKYVEDGVVPKQPKSLKWYSTAKGSSRTLEMVDMTDDSFVMKGPNGTHNMKHSMFQPGCIKFGKRYISYLKQEKLGQQLAELEKDFIHPEKETWTSSKGKKIIAEFVELKGENLQLVIKKTGHPNKTYNFSLDKLDEASQEQAKKWKGILDEQKEKVDEAKKKLNK